MRGMLKRLRKGLSQIPAESIIALLGILILWAGVWLLSPAWSLVVTGSICYVDSLLGRIGRRK